MEFTSRYVAHVPDADGFIQYSEEDKKVWSILFNRQMKLLPGRACEAFLSGLKDLRICANEIPQLPQLGQILQEKTEWQLAPVVALISHRKFFELLANKQFPVATFIRSEEELNYVKEPDIFHEIFGHCPLLTNQVYADFIHDYACKVLTFPESDWPLLQRLFWFTVEFGLINTEQGIRAYGGGILSSIAETEYSIESDIPLRVLFDPVAVFRTPYRIDNLQPIYYVIKDFPTLFNFVLSDIVALLSRARRLGEFPPFFLAEPDNPNVHIKAC
ncbi:MAG: phenylalanine 4-monooxygenase [Legionella sp.]|nr:phenylalanine 4-monooxygenase [Legionella sp.]